jgi:hypothetical protein
MRSKEPGNQPPICSMADRLAAFEKRMTDERDERAIQSALVSGRFALGALQGFSSGEGAAIMNRIHEAAKTDSGGVASVLAEMREAGRVADLRGQFNTALSTDLRMGNALDRAAAALDRYGQDRGKVEDIVERRPDAKAITARLERMDAAIGEAAATTPSRTDGRSLLADLSRQPAEVLRRAADTAKSALLPPLSADKISQSLPVPSMSTG